MQVSVYAVMLMGGVLCCVSNLGHLQGENMSTSDIIRFICSLEYILEYSTSSIIMITGLEKS